MIDTITNTGIFELELMITAFKFHKVMGSYMINHTLAGFLEHYEPREIENYVERLNIPALDIITLEEYLCRLS